MPRFAELAAAGHPSGVALDRIGRAFLLSLQDDVRGVLATLEGVERADVGPEWLAVAGWMRAGAFSALGDMDAALASLDEALSHSDPSFRPTLEYTRLAVLWSCGRVDEMLQAHATLLPAVEATGVMQNIAGVFAVASRSHSHVGDEERAEPLLMRAESALATVEQPAVGPARMIAFARASLLYARADARGCGRRAPTGRGWQRTR